MFSQVDSEGHHYQLLSEITNHRKDATAIPKSEGFYMRRGGNKVAKKTIRGWELLVEWKDGSSNWIALKDLKVSNPIELAEYAIANELQDEPAFQWWIREAIRQRNRIIKKIKRSIGALHTSLAYEYRRQ